MQDILPVKSTSKKSTPFFKDTLQTVDDQGRRNWIYPRRPSGKLYNLRSILAAVLLMAFFITPFIRINGQPLMLFNIFERNFIIFSQTFWPQDFHLLVISIISLLVFIILFTVVYGRIFCGWACPQTIFMEFVFRQIEYLVEGSHTQQRKLNQQPWTTEKIVKKSIKHLAFIVFSLAVINTLFAYIIGTEQLFGLYRTGFSGHPALLTLMILLTAAYYGIYAFFREQVCILICPYGRLQGVLLDERSIVVAYDYKRGTATAGTTEESLEDGDCIDCSYCVSVCPTGIDIRNGTQLECINCAACIDACDGVMERLERPKGLIRYDSERGISTGVRKVVSPRAVAYTAILTLLLAATVTLFIMRGEVEATVIRIPGTLYQEYGIENFSNMYTIQLVNKSNTEMPVEIRMLSPRGEIVYLGNTLSTLRGRMSETNFMIVIPKHSLQAGNTPVQLGIFDGERLIETYRTNFIAPIDRSKIKD
jgi:cytochrome c oxidase accessory protein FixG